MTEWVRQLKNIWHPEVGFYEPRGREGKAATRKKAPPRKTRKTIVTVNGGKGLVGVGGARDSIGARESRGEFVRQACDEYVRHRLGTTEKIRRLVNDIAG